MLKDAFITTLIIISMYAHGEREFYKKYIPLTPEEPSILVEFFSRSRIGERIGEKKTVNKKFKRPSYAYASKKKADPRV